jgi:hypothetical protein
LSPYTQCPKERLNRISKENNGRSCEILSDTEWLGVKYKEYQRGEASKTVARIGGNLNMKIMLLLLALMVIRCSGRDVVYMMVDTATPPLVFMIICAIITSIVWNVIFRSDEDEKNKR